MKKIFLAITILLIISCSSDDSTQEVVLIVNHYKQTAIGLDKTLVLLVQENKNIDNENWTYLYNEIEGFNYELGYIYELNVKKHNINNPPNDNSSVKYELINVISKTPVQNNVTFNLLLKSSSMISPPNFVTGDISSGFKILDEISINCNTICNDLTNTLETENEVKGVFSHDNSNTIKLEELISE